jgi:GntR family transcriptional repressor for pyruvate dehydrogenase complex
VSERKRRTKLRDRAVEEILDLVVSSDLSPGERLPPERELCERLGVSRTVVREALNLLEVRGVLEIEHGRGAVVSNDSTQAMRDTLGLLLRVQPRALGELLEIRQVLEVEIAGFAAERATPEDIEAMREPLERMRSLIDVPEGYVDADVEFHAQLARSTRNRVLLRMLEPVVELLRASRRVSASIPGTARRALEEHEAILKRVAARDAGGARAAMREHLTATARDLEEAMGGHLEGPEP